MSKFYFFILCLFLSVGSDSFALDVAAKHLEDYQQQRKACGNEDELATLRLMARYQMIKSWAADEDTFWQNQKDMQAMRQQAYRLAKTRYAHGLASIRDVYETGAKLYAVSDSDNAKGTQPTIEELSTMRLALNSLRRNIEKQGGMAQNRNYLV